MGMEIAGHLPSNPRFDLVGSVGTPRRTQGREHVDFSEFAPTRDEIEKMVREIQTSTQAIDKRLKFTVNEELNRIVVKVIDAKTDKVIKELPPDSLQRIQARMREAIGMLLDEQI